MYVVGSIIKKALEIKQKLPLDKRKQEPILLQLKVLKKMLIKAQNTSFGEYYGFSDILKSKNLVTAFQSKIPIFDYNKMYNEWWYRSLNGESFVSWPGQVKYFALSSGTSEASSKYIPITPDMLKSIKKTSVRQIYSLGLYDLPKEFFQKKILMLGGSTHLNFNGTYYEGDLSGITASNIPFWFQHHYKPGKKLSRERDWKTKLDEIVQQAPSWDIGAIVGVPAWLQILLEKIIKTHNLETIHDIWPNLTVLCHGGVSFTPYQKSFEKLIKKPLVCIETYLASEGFIAYQTTPGNTSMKLVLDNGLFFEFVPFNNKNFDFNGNIIDNPIALTIDQINEGEDYALLLSSVAGIWRYLIGDVIRFTSKEKYEVQIVGRTKHYLSLCGEHLSVENMTRAIEMLEKECEVSICEFTVAGENHHQSMFVHNWWLGTKSEIDSKLAAQKIDEHLKILNDDYRVERLEAIKEVNAHILPVSKFYQFLEIKGKEGGQHKFPRVLKGKLLEEWKEFLKNN